MKKQSLLYSDMSNHYHLHLSFKALKVKRLNLK